jgi:hypothetical protein
MRGLDAIPPDPVARSVARQALLAGGLDELERLANAGGPMSRGRSERLSASILGADEGAIRCPRVLRVGLDFGTEAPLTTVRAWLQACGFSSEGEARAAIVLPPDACICRPDPHPRPTPIGALRPRDALFQALVLGLCTAWCYDPRRPVLWTTASLTRQLELFDGRGFYA